MKVFSRALLVATIIACVDRSPPLNPSAPSSADKTKSALAGRPPRAYDIHADSTGRLVGEVSLRTAAGGKVLVLSVDTVPQDGIADRFFTLQSETAFGDVDARHAAGIVEYQNTQVDVQMPSERRAFRMYILGRGNRETKLTPGAVVFAGFGLARRTGQYALENGQLTSADVDQIVTLSCNFGVAIGPFYVPHCQAGGLGSTSCSINGCQFGEPHDCSTSCGAGFFACCNCLVGGASCPCLKNPGAGAVSSSANSGTGLLSSKTLWAQQAQEVLASRAAS